MQIMLSEGMHQLLFCSHDSTNNKKTLRFNKQKKKSSLNTFHRALCHSKKNMNLYFYMICNTAKQIPVCGT